VREMAHVRVIDVAPYEPAHRAPCDHIRSEVLLRRDSRRAHYPGQAVRSYAHDFLVFMHGGVSHDTVQATPLLAGSLATMATIFAVPPACTSGMGCFHRCSADVVKETV
jgi:hypothetical protein